MILRARPVIGLGVFVGAVFLAESAFYSVVPPLVPDLVAAAHMTTTEVGVLVAAYPAGVMIAAIPAIALVDRCGVRITTSVGLGLLTIATLAFGWTSTSVVLDAARFVQGMGGAVAWAAALLCNKDARKMDRMRLRMRRIERIPAGVSLAQHG